VTALVFAASAAGACLPADTRPPPAIVTLSVVADEPSPFTTADGWSVSVERLLMGAGNAALDDGCIRYSEGRYDRVLDARLPGEQKLSVLYGLGTCNLRYRIAGPSVDTLLGQGVSEADKLALGTPAPSPYTDAPERASVELAATARRGNETARVHWFFRQVVRYRNCGELLDADAGTARSIAFESNAAVAYHLAFHAENLLRDDRRGGALRFDAIAAADRTVGDNDGETSLDELARVPLELARAAGPYTFDTDADAAITASDAGRGVRSLGDYVVWVLLPRALQFREPIRCTPEVQGSPVGE